MRISIKEVYKIVNKNLHSGGGNELEISLAKKCIRLYKRITQLNKERNELIYTLYSIKNSIEKKAYLEIEEIKQKNLLRGINGSNPV